MKPYTYYIHWSTINKSYYGVKFGKDANPDTFWKDYFTSSKYVKHYRAKYGEPDVIKVRKIFTEAVDACKWEAKVLTRLKAVHKEEWLNKHSFLGRETSDEIRQKISNTLKGRKQSKESNEKRSKSLKGRKFPKEFGEKISKSKRSEITIYSTLQDKSYTWSSVNVMLKETGFGSYVTKLLKGDGLLIKKRTPRTRHNFKEGDVLLAK